MSKLQNAPMIYAAPTRPHRSKRAQGWTVLQVSTIAMGGIVMF